MKLLKIGIRKNKRAKARIEVQTVRGEQFTISERKPIDFLDKLTRQEQFELEWLLGSVSFNFDNYEVDAGQSEEMRLFLAPEFRRLLFKFWKDAKEQGKEFNPARVMLEALKKDVEKLK